MFYYHCHRLKAVHSFYVWESIVAKGRSLFICFAWSVVISGKWSSSDCSSLSLLRLSLDLSVGLWFGWRRWTRDRSGHSGWWHSSWRADPSWAGGEKCSAALLLSCRWMELSVLSRGVGGRGYSPTVPGLRCWRLHAAFLYKGRNGKKRREGGREKQILPHQALLQSLQSSSHFPSSCSPAALRAGFDTSICFSFWPFNVLSVSACKP